MNALVVLHGAILLAQGVRLHLILCSAFIFLAIVDFVAPVLELVGADLHGVQEAHFLQV